MMRERIGVLNERQMFRTEALDRCLAAHTEDRPCRLRKGVLYECGKNDRMPWHAEIEVLAEFWSNF